MLAPGVATGTVPRPCGPPTPRTGPANPAGQSHKAVIVLTSLGGGPSTVIETRFSPLSRTRPRTLFSSRSGCLDIYLIFLNSSQSHRMRFMCLSKALNVPIKMRPSWRIHRILKSTCCSILLLFPTVCTATRYHYIHSYHRSPPPHYMSVCWL
uniref:Uncharacterized protein n=1 Tax=Gouania willdenowi TaxID=441366 RepID=A0A8C5EKZ5_GOUWI